MAKRINGDIPDDLQKRLRVDRAERDMNNSEVLTEALADYYDTDPQEAREQLQNELSEADE